MHTTSLFVQTATSRSDAFSKCVHIFDKEGLRVNFVKLDPLLSPHGTPCTITVVKDKLLVKWAIRNCIFNTFDMQSRHTPKLSANDLAVITLDSQGRLITI
jgi:hypothetical protein